MWPSNPFRVCNSPDTAKIKRLSLGNFENTLNRLRLKSIFDSWFCLCSQSPPKSGNRTDFRSSRLIVVVVEEELLNKRVVVV